MPDPTTTPPTPPAADQNWTQALAPEQQELAKIKGWKAPADVLTGYQALEKLVGVDHIAMPAKDAQGNFDQKGVTEVLARLGYPKDANGYAVPTDIKIEPGVPFKVEQLEGFKAIAHKHGMLPGQFQGVMRDFVEMLNQGLKISQAQEAEQINKAELALRQEVGTEFQAKKALAERALNSIIDQPRAKKLAEKYGKDPDFIKLLMNVGENLSEETFSSADLISGIQGPAAAKAELDKMRSDPAGALMNARHIEHKAAVEKAFALEKIIAQAA